MQQLLRTHGNLAAWAALLVLASGIVGLETLQWMHPEWFCRPISPGGLELVCGGDYSAPAIRFAQRALLATCAGFYVFGLASIPLGGTRWGGKLVLFALTAIAIGVGWVARSFAADCFP
jgi:hypothetical protein